MSTVTPRHIYNEDGHWVAFIVGTEVFRRGGEWLGQLCGRTEVRDHDGRLRGLLSHDGKRLSILAEEKPGITVS